MLDTNIASFVIKGNRPALDRRLARIPVGNVFISAVTEAELRYGVARIAPAPRLEMLVKEFLLTVTILPWDSAAALAYAELRTNLERAGQPMSNLDLMIAAHALAGGAILVTNDRAFSRIRNLEVVDWSTA